MQESQIVTCKEMGSEERSEYVMFTHEADMVLLTVSQGIEDGSLNSHAATEAMRPYREYYPDIFESDFDLEDYGWESLAGAVMENEAMHATSNFIDEAASLQIPGVHDDGGSPGSGPILTVESNGALRLLQQKMKGKYEIIALDNDTEREWQVDHEAAYRVIARLRHRVNVSD